MSFFPSNMIKKLLKSDKTDQEVDSILDDVKSESKKTSASIKRSHKLFYNKTTTYYLGKAMGVVK